MTSLQQERIARELGIDRQLKQGGERIEIDRRVGFIKQVLRESGCMSLVLGISGGVDSLTAGRLCQLAVEQLRNEDYEARFIAVRLPYKAQADEQDAQASLDFIQPDLITTSNIAACVDGLMATIAIDGLQPSAELIDFVKGNAKARARMLAQYAIANMSNGLVVGTDHGAEAVMGFFTKFGDGACDLAPLSGLTKTQVRLLADAMGAPAHRRTWCARRRPPIWKTWRPVGWMRWRMAAVTWRSTRISWAKKCRLKRGRSSSAPTARRLTNEHCLAFRQYGERHQASVGRLPDGTLVSNGVG